MDSILPSDFLRGIGTGPMGMCTSDTVFDGSILNWGVESLEVVPKELILYSLSTQGRESTVKSYGVGGFKTVTWSVMI